VLNFSPRPATITKIETLADGPDRAVVATLGPDEALARSLLLASFGTPFTEIPTGRTGVVLLDDVFPTRADVPTGLTHRIGARFGAAESAGLEAVAARYPDTVSQIGGAVQVSDQTPVIIGPPLAGSGWEPATAAAGSPHTAAGR